MTLDEAFDLFNRHGNVGRSPEDFRTQPPLKNQLHEAGARVFQATGDQKAVYEAMALIWGHFYPKTMRYTREEGVVYAYDPTSGVYGTADYRLKDADSHAARDMLANPKQISAAESVDWKKACMHILHGVLDAEGTWFENNWRLDPLIRFAIDKAYAEWEGPPEKKDDHSE